jgi:hypothetical protein
VAVASSSKLTTETEERLRCWMDVFMSRFRVMEDGFSA